MMKATLIVALGYLCGSLASPALALEPLDDPIEDTCLTIHLNHFYDDNGDLVFSQFIFQDWPPHNIAAWRLVKDESITPAWHPHTGEWSLTWWDGSYLRKVRAKRFMETWKQYDVELQSRFKLPQDRRRQLTTPRTTTTSGASDGDLGFPDTPRRPLREEP